MTKTREEAFKTAGTAKTAGTSKDNKESESTEYSINLIQVQYI